MMSYEDTLRRQLHEQAGAVPLPERRPERAAHRARARRRHRLATAGAGVAVLLAGAAAVAVSGDDRPDSVSMAGPGLAGLPQVGPVDLDWQVTDGGLSPSSTETFLDATGTVYALSTAPGEAPEDEEPARALYRLGDDGAWVPVVLDGGRPRLADASAAGGLIYAVSTSPDATTAMLSTSGDEGDTWSSEDVAPVAPPSDVIAWDSQQLAGVESVGDTTLAIVTTVFTPNFAQLFPESVGTDMSVEERPEGLALVRPAGGTSGPTTTRPPTSLPADPSDEALEESAESVQASGALDGAVTAQEMEVVRVVTWAEMGLDGPGQTRTTLQAFRNGGEGWEPVEGDLAGQLAGTSSVGLDVAADQFLVTAWDDGGTRALRSPDGVTWAEVNSPTGGTIVAAGPALVALPDPASVESVDALQASADGGATWEPVDLGPAGLPDGGSITDYDGGPLGLALVLAGEDGVGESVAVTADLASWTVTPLADLAGDLDASGGWARPYVGADRVLVSIVESDLASEGPPRSRTAVGTPVR